MNNISSYIGCLIGSAAGDALGYEVEFMCEKEIFSKFGASGITDYVLHNGNALISDDTQMTLFTATGLLNGYVRGKVRGIFGGYPSYIRHHYKAWYKTQNMRYSEPTEFAYSWLMYDNRLYSQRAPGVTCLTALESDNNGSIDNSLNNSKGCGGIMRVAPIGLWFARCGIGAKETALIGAEAAAITHGHPLGYIPSGFLSVLIREIILDGEKSLRDLVCAALETTEKVFAGTEYLDDFSRLIKMAIELSEDSTDTLTAIHKLGEGWVAEETAAIAVFCALRYCNSFEKAIAAAVNHNGDSDSTGAICGNILGAYLGLEAIPDKFRNGLELSDIITEIASDLWEVYDFRNDGCAEEGAVVEKYLRCKYKIKE